MDELFSRQTKTETVAIKTVEKLVSLTVGGDHFGARYVTTARLPDGTNLVAKNFSVDRSILLAGNDSIEFNGRSVTLGDWIGMGSQFSEMWRAADDRAQQEANAEV